MVHYYDYNNIYYHFIPLLAFTCTAAHSSTIIVYRLYEVTNRVRDKIVYKYIPNNKDNFVKKCK